MTSNGKPRHQLTYRPDIQGLRALAILLVVAAHAHLKGFAGGFVGVDVFFVLSGYLITALLMQELQEKGHIRFARFYVRRLRRLLPGLFLMLIGVGVLAWLLLPALDQSRQAASAINAAAWISNIYFALLHVGYFSPDAASNLFLHTWSLGVEEQFYLLWPMLIAAAYAGWTHGTRSDHNRRMLLTLSIVGACSLAVCLIWSYTSPKLAFYMMPARGWQFALGGVVYLLFGVSHAPGAQASTARRFRLPAWLGWLGLAMILASAMVLDGNTVYPGFWALAPSIGSAAVIAAGVNPRTRLVQILSIRPMRWIGNVSYSWYLWHWPILLLGTYGLGYHTPVERLGLVALSLALATLSHVFVERPVRHASWALWRPRLTLAGAGAVIVAVLLLGRTWDRTAVASLHSPAQQRLTVAQSDTPLIYLQGCDSWYESPAVKPCIYGPADARRTAVVIGDSVGLQWFPAIHQIFQDRHWRLIVMTKSSCPMVDEAFYYARIKRVYANCAIWRKQAFAKLADYKPDVVILGSTYTYPFTRKEWIDGTRKLVAQASKAAGKVYLLRSTPTLPFNGPDCLAPHSALYRRLSRHPHCTSAAHNKRFDEVYAWRREAASSFGNVSSIDMTSAICPSGLCRAGSDGLVVFRDDQHMTASFARSLAPQLAAKMKLAPTKSPSIARSTAPQSKP